MDNKHRSYIPEPYNLTNVAIFRFLETTYE